MKDTLIDLFDQFPSVVEPNFKGSTGCSSIYSLALSFVYYGVSIWVIIFNIMQFFTNNAPNVVTTRQSYDTNNILLVPKDDFSFSFLLSDNKNAIIPINTIEGPSQIEADYSGSSIQAKSTKVGAASKCNEDPLTEKLNTNIDKIKEESVCVNFDRDYSVGGSIFTGTKESIVNTTFEVDLCQKYSGFCDASLSSAKALEILPKMGLLLNYKTFVPKLDNKDPFEQEIYSQEMLLSPVYDYKMEFELEISSVSTDPNFLFNFLSSESDQKISIVGIKNEYYLKEDFRKTKVEFNFKVKRTEVLYSRSYTKLDDVAANIGAVVGVVASVLAALSALFSEGLIEKQIAEACYHTKASNQPDDANLINEPANSEAKTKVKKAKIEPIKVKLSLLDSIKLTFGLKTRSKLDKIVELVEKDTDWVEIVRKMLIVEDIAARMNVEYSQVVGNNEREVNSFESNRK